MKFLKYLLILLLVLVLAFIAKGLLTPSINFASAEVFVNKPANEAWEVMSDKENLTKWIKGFKRTELVSGTPNTVGAVSNVYVEEGGQEMVMQETIKEVDLHKRLAMEFKMDFMDMDYEITFDEIEGKTSIKSNSIIKGNGMFAKSIVSFMKGSMKSQEDENLGTLKKLIEENTKDYFGDVVELQ